MGEITFLPVRANSGTGGGPPFPLNAADNGLSVDGVTGRIVLGGDVGAGSQFLNDREIDFNGFSLNCFDPTYGPLDMRVRLDVFGLNVQDVVSGDGAGIGCDPGGNGSSIGLFSSGGGGAQPKIDFGNTAAGSASSTQMQLRDLGNFDVLQNPGSPTVMLRLNASTGLYELGDVVGFSQGTKLIVDDTAVQLRFESGGQLAMNLSPGPELFLIGDLGGSGSGIQLRLEGAANNLFEIFQSINSDPIAKHSLLFDGNTSNFKIGDIDASGNNFHIEIDDVNTTFFIRNALTSSKININGIDGVTGVFAPVNSITVEGGIVVAVT